MYRQTIFGVKIKFFSLRNLRPLILLLVLFLFEFSFIKAQDSEDIKAPSDPYFGGSIAVGWYLGRNMSVFTGDYSKNNNPGLGGLFGFAVAGDYLEMLLTFDYHRNSNSAGYLTISPQGHLTQLIFLGNIKINMEMRRSSKSSAIPYFLVGGGLVKWSKWVDVQGTSFIQGGSSDGEEFGYILGLGIDFYNETRTRAGFFQIRMLESGPSDPFDSHFFFLLTAGIRFGD